MATNLENARKYISLGFSVMPMNGPMKKPYVEWKEFQTRYATDDEVTSWWTQWPDADIAIICGKLSGITVVDAESRADLSLFGLDTLETPRVRTGGGGNHFYCAYYPGIKNSTKFAPEYDLKTEGGYVMAPPTMHKSGKRYTWDIPWGTVNPAPLPAQIPPLVAKRLTKMQDIISGISPDGHRNDNATSVAGKLLSRLPEREWETEAWPLLQSWNATKAKPPLPNEELLVVFRSIAQAEKSRRVKGSVGEITLSDEGDNILAMLPVDDSFAMFEFSDFLFDSRTQECLIRCHIERPEGNTRSLSFRLNLVSISARESFLRQFKESFDVEKKSPWPALLSEIFDKVIEKKIRKHTRSLWNDITIQEHKYLLHPFVVKNAPNALFGKGGTGKTFFALRAALSVAFGIPFTTYLATERQNVLFVDFEDDDGEYKDRLTKVINGLPQDMTKPTDAEMNEHLFYFDSKGLPLANLLQPLREVIHADNIGLIIIDSAAKACGGKVEDSDTTNKFFNALKTLGTTSLVIAHESKNALIDNEYIFGSSYWNYSFRNVWKTKVDREQDENIIHTGLIHCKSNRGKLQATRAMRLYFGNDFTEFNQEDPVRFAGDMGIKPQILSALSERPYSVPDLAKELGKTDNLIRARLSELATKGVVVRGEDFTWSLKREPMIQNEPEKTEERGDADGLF